MCPARLQQSIWDTIKTRFEDVDVCLEARELLLNILRITYYSRYDEGEEDILYSYHLG
jgi:hypothetical protein